MQPNDEVKITGELLLKVVGADGQEKDHRHIKNLVVNAGKDFIASRMKDTAKAAMTHVGVGSGSTAPAAGDTALQTQIVRQPLTSTTVTGSQVAYSASFPAGVGTGTWREAGLFNAPSAGDMLARTVFGDLTKGATDSVVVNWTVTVG